MRAHLHATGVNLPPVGIEPTTFGLWDQRDYQLRHSGNQIPFEVTICTLQRYKFHVFFSFLQSPHIKRPPTLEIAQREGTKKRNHNAQVCCNCRVHGRAWGERAIGCDLCAVCPADVACVIKATSIKKNTTSSLLTVARSWDSRGWQW